VRRYDCGWKQVQQISMRNIAQYDILMYFRQKFRIDRRLLMLLKLFGLTIKQQSINHNRQADILDEPHGILRIV